MEQRYVKRMRLLRWFNEPISPAAKVAAMCIGMTLLAIVGLLDWMTGPNLDFSLFYLIPVCFVAGYAGQQLGYAMSIVSAALWIFVDRLTGARPALPWIVYWNLFIRLAFFSVSVFLLEGWKTFGKKLSLMVDQRTAELRSLAAQLSAAEDAERRKLAYDMHDALSQTLSSIKITLDSALLQLGDSGATQRNLSECSGMIDGVIKQTRTLMFDLYPAMLDDLGLIPTLQWYAKTFEERTGVETAILQQGIPRELPRTLRNYLFRAGKELLSNAMRHGKSSEISVLICWEARSLRLVVDDDGEGFDSAILQSPTRRRGLGLAGISERVTSMGGQLKIETHLGQGTRVILEIPVSANDEVKDQYAIASAAG